VLFGRRYERGEGRKIQRFGVWLGTLILLGAQKRGRVSAMMLITEGIG